MSWCKKCHHTIVKLIHAKWAICLEIYHHFENYWMNMRITIMNNTFFKKLQSYSHVVYRVFHVSKHMNWKSIYLICQRYTPSQVCHIRWSFKASNVHIYLSCWNYGYKTPPPKKKIHNCLFVYWLFVYLLTHMVKKMHSLIIRNAHEIGIMSMKSS